MSDPEIPILAAAEADIENAPAGRNPATAQHLAGLIFLSYRYSQGAIGTQNRMLLYIEENLQPDLFTGPHLAEVKTLTHRMVGKFFLNQELHPATAIPWEDDSPEAAVKTELLVTNELAGLFERFVDREQIAGFDSDPVGIAQSVITMDYDYLTRPGGRAGDSEAMKIKVSPYRRDPHNSLFISHSVLGISTRTAEFDDIFGKLATDETVRALDKHTLRQLRGVASIYTQKHPDAADDPHIIRFSTLCEELLNAE